MALKINFEKNLNKKLKVESFELMIISEKSGFLLCKIARNSGLAQRETIH